MPRRVFRGWFVVAAICVVTFVNIAFPFYGGAVLNASMAKQLHLDRSTLGLGFTAMVLVQGVLGPVVAWVVGRIGPRKSIFVGSLVLAAGAVLMGTVVSTGWQYVIVFGSALALGMGLSASIPGQTAVTFWFQRRRALALSLVWAAAGGGGTVAAPLLQNIMAAAGGSWRVGWLFVAALATLAGVVALVVVRDHPEDVGEIVDGGAGPLARSAAVSSTRRAARVFRATESMPVREAFWTRANVLIMFGAIASGVSVTAVIPHAVVHLKELGHSPGRAAAGLGVLAAASVAGKLGAGFVGDRIEPRFLWSAGMVLMGAGVATLIRATTVVEIYLFGALTGLGQGISLVCRPALVGNYFGPKVFARMLGLQAPIVTVTCSLAPFLVGLAFDAQRSYTAALGTVASLVLCGAVLAPFARPPRRALPSPVVAGVLAGPP
jgi:MFS family permease